MSSLQPSPNRLSLHPKVAANLLVRNAAGFEDFDFLKNLVPADRRWSPGRLREGSRSTHPPGTLSPYVIRSRVRVKFGSNALSTRTMAINQGKKGI
jgi:hypothetical protein